MVFADSLPLINIPVVILYNMIRQQLFCTDTLSTDVTLCVYFLIQKLNMIFFRKNHENLFFHQANNELLIQINKVDENFYDFQNEGKKSNLCQGQQM